MIGTSIHFLVGILSESDTNWVQHNLCISSTYEVIKKENFSNTLLAKISMYFILYNSLLGSRDMELHSPNL